MCLLNTRLELSRDTRMWLLLRQTKLLILMSRPPQSQIQRMFMRYTRPMHPTPCKPNPLHLKHPPLARPVLLPPRQMCDLRHLRQEQDCKAPQRPLSVHPIANVVQLQMRKKQAYSPHLNCSRSKLLPQARLPPGRIRRRRSLHMPLLKKCPLQLNVV